MSIIKNNEIIGDFVDKLKKSYKPDLIILFGSRAAKDFNQDSDFDLLVVKNTRKRPIWRRVDVRRILSAEVPLDVIVYTPSEFKQLKESGSAFLKQILKEGKIIYEKK